MSREQKRKARRGRKYRASSKKPFTPRCPVCHTRGTLANAEQLYYCTGCGGFFDLNPDEGGDYSSRNPAARIERAERERTKRHANREN